MAAAADAYRARSTRATDRASGESDRPRCRCRASVRPGRGPAPRSRAPGGARRSLPGRKAQPEGRMAALGDGALRMEIRDAVNQPSAQNKVRRRDPVQEQGRTAGEQDGLGCRISGQAARSSRVLVLTRSKAAARLGRLAVGPARELVDGQAPASDAGRLALPRSWTARPAPRAGPARPVRSQTSGYTGRRPRNPAAASRRYRRDRESGGTTYQAF